MPPCPVPRLSRSCIREHYEGLVAGDEAAYTALVHEDFIQDWPQSGERVRGKEACLNIARNYPGGTPRFELGRISGEGDHWVVEATSRYPDGTDYHVVGGLKLSRTTMRRSVEADPQRAEELADLAPRLGRPDVAVHPATGGVVGGEQVAHPRGAPVGRPEAGWAARLRMPAPSEVRLQVQGPELVEAEHARALGRMGVQAGQRADGPAGRT